ncbi:MAG: hypothetical protein J1E82_09245, partial [Muribaculaceae bacterium]|nr:hypothetical protein [Muribaculaceae bacterium]
MNKKILTLLSIAAISATAFAEVQSLDFTYASGTPTIYGKGKKEIVDVAMCINDASFAGKKLTGFKAYISTTEGISDASLWLSNELTLENKLNAPDIASFSVTPSVATLEGNEYGLLEVELADPYEFTGEPVYLGYTINVTEASTPEQKKPMVLASNINENGLYVHMNKSILKWTNYAENAGGVAYIVASIEGDYQPYSADLLSYSQIYAMPDEPFEVELFVSNKGLNAIESLSYVYSYDGENQQYEGSVNLPAPLEPSLSASYPVTVELNPLSTTGRHDLNITITEVNGQPNMGTNPVMTCAVNVIPFIPVHRPLVEEFTGTWCGW